MDTPRDSPSLLHLPGEIVLYILRAVHSLSDLKSLILTAPSFNEVWRLYTASISLVILERSIESFDELWKLEVTVHPKCPAGFEPALKRLKRFIAAARLASRAHKDFVYDYSRSISYFWDPFLPYDPWELESYLEESKSRRSFKRSFYWLWRFVITSEYKPLVHHQSLDPFPVQRSDILSLCELTVWIISYAYLPPFSVLGKAYRIYNLKDRVRCAQTRRWELCCMNLWEQAPFQKARRDHWSLDLGLTVFEPWHGPLTIHGPWYEPLLLFLTNARENSYYQSLK